MGAERMLLERTEVIQMLSPAIKMLDDPRRSAIHAELQFQFRGQYVDVHDDRIAMAAGSIALLFAMRESEPWRDLRRRVGMAAIEACPFTCLMPSDGAPLVRPETEFPDETKKLIAELDKRINSIVDAWQKAAK